MRLPALRFLLPGVLAAAVAFAGRDKHKNEEVLPLPPEPPMALAAQTSSLDFHLSPLLQSGGLSSQIRQSLSDLIRETKGETIIRLRAFVSGTGDARRVQAQVGQMFTDRKLPLPVLAILQVGALGSPGAQVVIEAVVSTHREVNPAGLAFLFNQTGSGLPAAIAKLKASAEQSGVAPSHVLTTTCFTAEIADNASAVEAVRSQFPATEVNIIQAVRDPLTSRTTCEAIGQLTTQPEGQVQRPKDLNATLVNSPQLVFTGLQLSFGNYLVDAKEAFERLRKTVSQFNTADTPVEVDGFSLDPYAASALLKTNTFAPGVFNVETIEGLPSVDATGGIEAILAAAAPAGSAATPGYR